MVEQNSSPIVQTCALFPNCFLQMIQLLIVKVRIKRFVVFLTPPYISKVSWPPIVTWTGFTWHWPKWAIVLIRFKNGTILSRFISHSQRKFSLRGYLRLAIFCIWPYIIGTSSVAEKLRFLWIKQKKNLNCA